MNALEKLKAYVLAHYEDFLPAYMAALMPQIEAEVKELYDVVATNWRNASARTSGTWLRIRHGLRQPARRPYRPGGALMGTRIGRSWKGTSDIEALCPCPKAPCGLVDMGNMSDECKQHPPENAKTIRTSHRPEDCPEIGRDVVVAMGRTIKAREAVVKAADEWDGVYFSFELDDAIDDYRAAWSTRPRNGSATRSASRLHRRPYGRLQRGCRRDRSRRGGDHMTHGLN
ncbi:hypothetical protein SMICM17S_10319 [Streptomyces microflavus]